ncbi:RHS repeat-associated protein [Schleiferia thermophila]|uniref:RHS repeat-associated protein n=3 Tax=Schleiferia thermophila TaxID=884107 RepID=A0A368ZVL6_9FLAO|nr:RHS repeat-associated protein [Schleiferia thermophila]
MRQHHAQSPHILFYYHPDYLGHVEYVTDGAGVPYQYFHYSPWGESLISQTRTPNSTGFSTPYRFNAKELDSESGLFYYGARYYHPVVSKWLSVDPMAHEREWLSSYNFVQNNPILRVDPDGRLDDIVITGENNSSVTIKTDLIDVSVNAGSIVGDLGGNYTLEGTDVLIAALDIVGIVDPTGVADVAAATLEAKQGNYGSAILSGLGVVPLIGDLGKVGKIGKHMKTINNAIDGAKAVNGNSKASTKAQHVYEIFETGTGNVVKTGISGGKVSQADKSYRATSQVNQMNKASGSGTFDSRIVEKIPSWPGARQQALDAEKANAAKNRSTLNPNYHKRP